MRGRIRKACRAGDAQAFDECSRGNNKSEQRSRGLPGLIHPLLAGQRLNSHW